MKNDSKQNLGITSTINAKTKSDAAFGFKNTYLVECFDSEGNLKWVEENHNRVFDAALTDVLEKYFNNGTTVTTWYCGLIAELASGENLDEADDTLGNFNFTEDGNYAGGGRVAVVFDTAAAKSISTGSTPCEFQITGTASIEGAFITDQASGTSGLLYGASLFSAVRNVENNDVLNVTVTITTETLA